MTSNDDQQLEFGPYPSASHLSELIGNGRLMPHDIVTASKRRFDALARSHVDYRSLLGWVSDVQAQLRRLSSISPQTAPLFGLPVIIKDNIAIKGEPTTAGSWALRANIAADDADVISELRAAGAIILARSNLSEWANFRDNRSTSGWSSVGGQTRNAYDPSRTPCGSSAGSAVAVALGYAPLALGTETDGSIICPAAINGIVGIKPTRRLISQKGVIPLAKSQDVVGPMARNTKDAAQLLSVIIRGEYKHLAPAIRRAALEPEDLKTLRLGVITNLGQTNERVNTAFTGLQDKLSAAGTRLIPVHFPDIQRLKHAAISTIYYEFQRDLNRYLKARKSQLPVDSLSALIRYNQTHSNKIMPHFGQDRLIQAERMADISESSYRVTQQLAKRLAGPDGLDRLLRAHKLDGLIAPSNGPAWDIDYTFGDRYEVGSSTPSAVAGYPAVTVPMGQIDGRPIGVSIMGPEFGDPRVISIAAAIEELTGGFVPPTRR